MRARSKFDRSSCIRFCEAQKVDVQGADYLARREYIKPFKTIYTTIVI